MLEPKIRIQLKDKDTGAIIGDRLVSVTPEFYAGPKEKHEGPFKIEIDLHSKKAIEDFKIYLDKLAGNLPLDTKVSKKSKEEILPEHPVDEMVDKITKCKTQDNVIEYLKGLGYRFITTDVIDELLMDKKTIFKFHGEPHREYQWMVKVIKEAKDPSNDKYDFSIMVGIKLIGKKREKVHIYINETFSQTLQIPWPDKSVFNMKEKKKLTVFPQYMTIEERKKWRYYARKFEAGKELTKGEDKFYHRWASDIKKLNESKVS